MPLFIDKLPFQRWTDATRTPPLSQWTIVLPVALTEPMLLNPPPVASASDWVLDTGNRGEAFAWRHHLMSSKKNYALWIYYHRLDKDILFKALLNYVEPKIKLVLGQLSFVRGQIQSTKDQGPRTKDQKKLEKEAERLEGFVSELRDFEDKLRRAANLHLEPDLNDGVVLNIAPLHELVPWKEARKYWDELLEGKYEWSSIGKQLREKGIVRC